MKIEIKTDWGILTLTNEHLDNLNFVDLYTEKIEEEITVPVDELCAALSAFKQLRD